MRALKCRLEGVLENLPVSASDEEFRIDAKGCDFHINRNRIDSTRIDSNISMQTYPVHLLVPEDNEDKEVMFVSTTVV